MDGAPDTIRIKAVTLADGSKLVVGLNSMVIAENERAILVLFGGAFVLVVLFGGLSALTLGRYLAGRLSAVTQTAQAIIAGDLGQRIVVGKGKDEFDSVALALNTMLDRIAGLMENLRQVSSDVAHDLRTPLLRLRKELDELGQVDGAAERAIAQGDLILRLFNAILRISEVESGELNSRFVDIDLSALVEIIADGFRPALQDSGHNLSWQAVPDIHVTGDRDLLAQMMSNLLDNSRIHTPAGTRVIVCLQQVDGMAALTVRDDGPGVSDEERPALLRRFYRAKASRTTPGNGLGLNLVLAVATAHGGSVRLANAAPGLSVTVKLPLAMRPLQTGNLSTITTRNGTATIRN